MTFSVTIDQFEGPLDLMLYLIREKKLDLFDLDIAELTTQYVAYIHQMRENSLEIASEYISELAGLIEYKSKRLLPRDESELDAEEPDDEKSLVARLLEYQMYKDFSSQLSDRYLQRQLEFDRPASYHTLKDQEDDEFMISNDIYDLIKAMNRLLIHKQKLNQSLQVQVTHQELSVDERIDQIRFYLKHHESSFNLEDIMRPSYSLQLQIVTFLAVLDMIRMNELVFKVAEDQQIYLRGVK